MIFKVKTNLAQCVYTVEGEEDVYSVVGIKSFEYGFGFYSVCYTTFSFDDFYVWSFIMSNVWKVMAALYNVIL